MPSRSTRLDLTVLDHVQHPLEVVGKRGHRSTGEWATHVRSLGDSHPARGTTANRQFSPGFGVAWGRSDLE